MHNTPVMYVSSTKKEEPIGVWLLLELKIDITNRIANKTVMGHLQRYAVRPKKNVPFERR